MSDAIDKPIFPMDLLQSLHERRVLPVVGLGVPDIIFRDEAIPVLRDNPEADDLDDWFRRLRGKLKHLYNAVAALPVDGVISLTPDEELRRVLTLADRNWLALGSAQAEYDDRKRLFFPLAGSTNERAGLLWTDADWLSASERKPILWELAQSYAARTPLLLLGCDPTDQRLNMILNDLRPHPYFRPGGWLMCSNISHADRERWQDAGFKVVTSPITTLLRELSSIGEIKSASTQATKNRLVHRTSPYLGLNYFQRSDSAFFFGREKVTRRLVDLVCAHRLVVVTGPSGTGKTSLLHAGLLAWIDHHPPFVGVYARCGENPTANLMAALSSALELSANEWKDGECLISLLEAGLRKGGRIPVIVLDQSEEIFTRFEERLRLQFLETIRDFLTLPRPPVRFVIALRDDYLARLVDLRDTVPSLLQNTLYVPPLGGDDAVAAICDPCRVLEPPVVFDEAVARQILADIGFDRAAPPQIQVVCERLFKERGDQGITRSLYNRLGGARRILTDFMADELRRLGDEQAIACELLKAMVTSEGTKDVLTVSEIARRAHMPPDQVESVLLHLRDGCRLVRSIREGGDVRFELAHEYLTGPIWEWMTQDDKDRREIEEILAKEVRSWRRFDTIRLGSDRLGRIEAYYKPATTHERSDSDSVQVSERTLELDYESLLLLLLSSVRHQHEARYWIEAIRKLGSVAQDRAAERLFSYFQNADLNQRCEAAESIAQLDVSPLLRALRSNQEQVRAAALEMLGGLGRRETAPAVILCIEDPAETETCRTLACGALGVIGGAQALQTLISVVKNGGHPETVLAALEALDRTWEVQDGFADGTCADILKQVIDQGDPRFDCQAIRAIGRAGFYKPVWEAICWGLNSNNGRIVAAAQAAVTNGQSAEIIKLLLQDNSLKSSARKALWDSIAQLPETCKSWFQDISQKLPQADLERWYQMPESENNWLRFLLFREADRRGLTRRTNSQIFSSSEPKIETLLPPDCGADKIANILSGPRRSEAIRLLAGRKFDDIHWRQLITDQEEQIRQAVLEIAVVNRSLTSNPSAIFVLLEETLKDSSVMVQCCACRLAEVHKVWDFLLRLLENNPPAQVRSRALQGLSKSPADQPISENLIRNALTSTHAPERYWGCLLALKLHQVDVLDLIRQLAWDEAVVASSTQGLGEEEPIDKKVGNKVQHAACCALDKLSPNSLVWRRGDWQSSFRKEGRA